MASAALGMILLISRREKVEEKVREKSNDCYNRQPHQRLIHVILLVRELSTFLGLFEYALAVLIHLDACEGILNDASRNEDIVTHVSWDSLFER